MAGPVLKCAGRTLDLSTPIVMGVLNVTPDSFSDGGRFLGPDEALAHAQRMQDEGAAIIDVGGESTRPGATPVAAEDELARVVPLIERLTGRLSAVISVDTSKPEVMRAAAQAGAGLINDVRALRGPGALEAAAGGGCAVCLVHMQGEPATMQRDPRYADVVSEVGAFLSARAQACRRAGLSEERIVIDPGFGFGKTLGHNLALLRGLPQLATSGYPVLAGLSRKSTVAALTGRPASERLAGSVALATIAVLNGALIVRAHDVAATLDAVRVASALKGSSLPPSALRAG
jgi:dihydropteroate synthase